MKDTKNAKIIICLILSFTIGIAAATPLIVAELNIQPWITHIQGPTAPFNVEIVYANFTITDVNTPITQTGGPTIDFYTVIKVTNPSDYRAMLSWMQILTGQEIQSSTSSLNLGFFASAGPGASEGSGHTARGAWVDGVYYDVTLTMPEPSFDLDGTMTIEPPFWITTEEELYTYYYQWIEGVQYYKRSVKSDTGINTYIYLNMNGTWVDVTGRVEFVEDNSEQRFWSARGQVASQWVHYTESGSNMIKDNEYNCFFEPGESRLLVFSGRVDQLLFAQDPNPIDVIKSGTIQTFIWANTIVTDIDHYSGGDNTFIDTWADIAEIQTINLKPVGNSYIYNTVLSDNQMFQLDQYGFEVFIVSRR